MAFRNRIIEYGVKPADQFLAHPDNPKFHPQFQRDVMSAALNEVGFVAPVIESRSGYLLDGHERVWTALANNNADVPFVVVDVEEAEESYVLATFDPIGRLSMHDAEQIDDLLKQVQTSDANMRLMLDAMVAEQAVQLTPPDANVPIPLSRYDVPDAIFASDNDYEIPLLDVNLQARTFDLPFAVWGSLSRQTRMNGGTYAFYTSDDRFEALWGDPSGIVNSGVTNIVEPNFSCYATMPVAVGVYQIYRKRWIARWCQTHGVRVLVDLNVAPKWRELNLCGVPKGWNAYMTRGSVEYLDELDEEYALACERAENSAPLFVVYGGGKPTQAVCKARGWLWVADQETRKRQMVTEMEHGE